MEFFLEAAILNGAVMLVVAAAHVLGFAFTYMGFADILLTNLPMGEMQSEFFLIVMSLVLIGFWYFSGWHRNDVCYVAIVFTSN